MKRTDLDGFYTALLGVGGTGTACGAWGSAADVDIKKKKARMRAYMMDILNQQHLLLTGACFRPCGR